MSVTALPITVERMDDSMSPTPESPSTGPTTAFGTLVNASDPELQRLTTDPNSTVVSGEPVAAVESAPSSASASSSSTPPPDDEYPYSIRLSPFVDHSSSMPAFYIDAVERKARDGTVIKVGRYDNKKDYTDAKGGRVPVTNPIVFKSKVVSRSHAEFVVEDGVWYIRDVKSSSGTFLNHVRLSLANEPSAAVALKDSDILQLGVDFRGGTEEVFKCIKVRVELNKSWHKKANQFHLTSLSNLRGLFAGPSATTADTTVAKSSQSFAECAICLLPVAPCQSLFIAPCSHVWHYKCIRPVIVKAYPHFLCPNCRTICDLETEIELPDLSHLDIEGLAN